MGRLYFEMMDSSSTEEVEHYYRLVRFYAAELLTTTNWMIGRRGRLTQVLRDAIDTSTKVSVVTFNHDLLVETVLDGLPRGYDGVWCMRHTYGGDPWGAPVAVNTQPRFDGTCSGNVDRHLRIYKLHGSLNWVLKTRNEYPPRDLLRSSRAVDLWDNKEFRGTERVTTKTKNGKGRTSWYLWPLVVPPIYEKQGFIHGRIRDAWTGAREASSRGRSCCLLGYSFPAADVHARYFFQAISQTSDALRAPSLVNPDPRAHAALWDILQPRRVDHYHDIVDYLARTRTS